MVNPNKTIGRTVASYLLGVSLVGTAAVFHAGCLAGGPTQASQSSRSEAIDRAFLDAEQETIATLESEIADKKTAKPSAGSDQGSKPIVDLSDGIVRLQNPFPNLDPEVLCQAEFERRNPGIQPGDRTGASLGLCAAGGTDPATCIRRGVVPRPCGSIDLDDRYLDTEALGSCPSADGYPNYVLCRSSIQSTPNLADIPRIRPNQYLSKRFTIPGEARHVRVRFMPGTSPGRDSSSVAAEGAGPGPIPVAIEGSCEARDGGRARIHAGLALFTLSDVVSPTGIEVVGSFDTTVFTSGGVLCSTVSGEAAPEGRLDNLETWGEVPGNSAVHYLRVAVNSFADRTGNAQTLLANNIQIGNARYQAADLAAALAANRRPQLTHVIVDWYGF